MITTILIVIGIASVVAVVLVIVSVVANNSVKKQARKIIKSGYVLDMKRAELILRVLGDRSVNNTREAEELYDKLKELIKETE